MIVVQNPTHPAPILPPGVEPFEKAQPLKSLPAAATPVAPGPDAPTSPYLDIMFATTPATDPPIGARAAVRERRESSRIEIRRRRKRSGCRPSQVTPAPGSELYASRLALSAKARRQGKPRC